MKVISRRGDLLLRHMEDTVEDYEMMHRWLNKPHVLASYSYHPSSIEEVMEKYKKRIKGENHVIPSFILYKGKEIGYIQFYPVTDEYGLRDKQILNRYLKPFAADIFIGEEDMQGKGLAPETLMMLQDYLFSEKDCDAVLIDPDIDNLRGLRAYEKAGFRRLTEFTRIGSDRMTVLMINERKKDMEGLIFKRRSIRKYIDKPIEKEKIERIVRAAQLAPSAMAVFPWEIVVTTDREKMKKVADVSPYGKFAKDAGAVFIMCGDLSHYKEGRGNDFWVQDCSAAIENILLQIVEEGLGGVWLGVYPIEERCNDLRKIFNIPEDIIPLGVIVCGYSDEENVAKDRFFPEKVHYEEY